MAKVDGVDKLFSALPRGRFGRFTKYGTAQFGFSRYGEDDVYFSRSEFGCSAYGGGEYGNTILLSGIYQSRNSLAGLSITREKYYIPKNPRSIPQQANRDKYAFGVAAWQALSSAEKEQYNKRVIGLDMSGYNLFLKEYLLT